jgi:hypothetical protein
MTYRIEVDTGLGLSGPRDAAGRRDFEVAEAAIATCKRIVDECLATLRAPGMSADMLFDHYLLLGDAPYIVSPSGRVKFCPWDYARHRSWAFCPEPAPAPS